jgi:hypothetical protein
MQLSADSWIRQLSSRQINAAFTDCVPWLFEVNNRGSSYT